MGAGDCGKRGVPTNYCRLCQPTGAHMQAVPIYAGCAYRCPYAGPRKLRRPPAQHRPQDGRR